MTKTEVTVKRFAFPAMAVLTGVPAAAADNPPKAMAVYVVGTSAEARDPDDATKRP